jgi:hypothetical protein
MRCLFALAISRLLPITHVPVVYNQCANTTPDAVLRMTSALQPHGFIVPRHDLNAHLLECARRWLLAA